MAEATEEGDVVQLSQRVHDYPRDLLQRFSSNKRSDESPSAAKEEPGELELSLGLSLGGCFGSDFKDNSLVRSSSIASLSFLTTDQEITAIPVLARTCSLPVETEEEQRKRKELQSLRRLEAKRKRIEKRNFKSGVKDRTDNCDEDMLDGDGKEGRFECELGGCRRFPGNVQFPVPNGVKHPGYEAAVGTRAAGRAVDGSRCFAPISQGSIGSQGSSLSVVSDFECRPMQGCGISGPDILDHKDQKTVVPPAASIARKVNSSTGEGTGDAPKKMMMGRCDGMKEMERNVMEEMPCVSTKGDGPNGRRIEGFLYRYRKGEDVRIMCVCHGSFLSPAEFVKHAGGGDVAHPLRHIVVNPSPSTFL